MPAEPTRLEIVVRLLEAVAPVYATKGYPRGMTRQSIIAAHFNMAEEMLAEEAERARIDQRTRGVRHD